jgi:putative membrane protein
MPKLPRGTTMKRFVLSAALVAALRSTAFAQSVGEQTGVNSALGIAPKTNAGV